MEAFAELLGGLDGTRIGGGIRIADGIAFGIGLGLRKYASQLDSRVWAGAPSCLPLRPSVSFFTTGTPVPSMST